MIIERLITQTASIASGGLIDIVAVYNENYLPVFRLARPMRASVKIDSKAMEQPLETGATFVDHRIILPTEIDLFLFLSSFSYRVVFDEILQIFNQGTKLIVQTRSGVYINQFMSSIPHEETTEEFDTIKMIMKLKEAKFITPQYEPVPSNPANKSTVNKGNVQSTPATTSQNDESSALYKLAIG